MAWSNWFNKRPALRSATAGLRRKWRLGCEALEDRTTPSVSSTLVSVALPTTAGSAASITSASAGASFSADENLFVFSSDASNLVPGDTNDATDVFVANDLAGTVTRVDVAADGTQAEGASFFPSISADGRYVAFQSYATNLVAADTNGTADVFVKDLQTGAVTLIKRGAATGTIANNFLSRSQRSLRERAVRRLFVVRLESHAGRHRFVRRYFPEKCAKRADRPGELKRQRGN